MSQAIERSLPHSVEAERSVLGVKLCECGCGQPAPVSKNNCKMYGWIKGQPKRFIRGHAGIQAVSPIIRFWRKVEKGSPSECWNWRGATNIYGYGILIVNGRITMAHRFSFQIANGSFDESLFVCHHCDNPPCVNPSHLFLGTQKDNMGDCSSKGRNRFQKGNIRSRGSGERNGAHKLTEDRVRNIFSLRAGGMTTRKIAELNGVSRRAVRNVLARKAWKHIEVAEQ